MMPPFKSERLDSIDALRGLAALAVLVHHAIDTCYDGLPPGIFDYFDLGKFGVFLFFALSGALIPFSFKKSDPNPNRHFLIGRFFRLYPMYWVSLILGIWLSQEPSFSWQTVLANVTMLQGFMNIPDVIGVYWTLNIEWAFYGVCLVLFNVSSAKWFLHVRKLPMLLLGAALLVAAGRYVSGIKLPVGLLLGLSVMFWGAHCRQNFDRPEPERSQTPAKMGLLYFLILIPVCVLAYNRDYGHAEKWIRYVTSYGIAMLVFYCGFNGAFWNVKTLRFVGRISYSVYLLHSLVLDLVMRGAMGPFSKVVLSVLLSILIGMFGFYVIETPFMALGRLIRKRTEPSPISA